MEKTNIAQNIRKLRILKGLSQEKLAELAQISLRTIQRIENNETEPRGHSLLQIANALNTTPGELGASVNTQLVAHYPQADRTYLAILNLSALSFFISPLLGVVVPFILWMIKSGQVININRTAGRLLIVQTICCMLLGMAYSFKILHWPYGGMMLSSIPFLYLINIVFVLVSAFRCWQSRKPLVAEK
ncbi:MAG: helix-turn-helix domain-containing protein [Mucilaginibacter sp.]|jgi:transcriptional regulator with XRE-family HTH domain|uniref:helix-turn-helix domain-containing protein n=1 Tax=Mucilaginibacter sp. TaxID=1882438 RepID=UPI0035677B77